MQNIPFCLFTPPQKGKKIVWEITSKCNMLCKHCCSNSSSKISQNEFNFSNQKLVNKKIDEMVLFGIKEFYITGGEPLLVKNIFNVLECLKRKKVKFSIATNGYFLTEKYIKKLSEIKINFLHISLDGHLPEIYNSLREGNFFNRVTKNIRTLRRYKIPVRIGCIVWQKNEIFLEKMVKLCINLKVKELRFSWLIRVGRFKENPQLYPKRKWSSVIKEIENFNKKYKNKIRITIHRMSQNKDTKVFSVCPGGNKLFFINPKGELAPCSWIAKIDSNFTTKNSLKKPEFKKLIKTKEISEFREIIQKRKDRNLIGCPFVAKYQNNSYYSNDNFINL